MRILHRPRPQIHFRQLSIFPVPGEEFLRRPGFQHEIDALPPALALLHRRYAVADLDVVAEAGRHAGNQAPAADAIEHRIFLGEADGRRRRDGGAELHQRDMVQSLIAGHLGQDGAEQIRIAHEPIGVLVVLVGADGIEAELGRQHQFVDRPIVIVGDLVGVAVLPPRRIDPGRRQLAGKIFRQIAIWHEMKHRDLHGHSSLCRRSTSRRRPRRVFCVWRDLTREPARRQAHLRAGPSEFAIISCSQIELSASRNCCACPCAHRPPRRRYGCGRAPACSSPDARTSAWRSRRRDCR